MRRYMMAVVLLIASLLAACSTAAHAGPDRARVVVGDGGNGSTVTLHKGDTLVVRLHSTYWHIAAPQAGGVLTLVDRAVHAVPIDSRRCVPGAGCGTVVATFRAQRAGQVEVRASRMTCGEAMGCTRAQSHYELTLVVD